MKLYVDVVNECHLRATSLSEILDIINNEHKQSIIMGDMNINLLKYDTHSKTNDYLNNLFSHGFLPLITKPTRVTPVTASLIDHIYTNNILHPGSSLTTSPTTSAHFTYLIVKETSN